VRAIGGMHACCYCCCCLAPPVAPITDATPPSLRRLHHMYCMYRLTVLYVLPVPQMVTKYKLGYDPVEVDPEDMVRRYRWLYCRAGPLAALPDCIAGVHARCPAAVSAAVPTQPPCAAPRCTACTAAAPGGREAPGHGFVLRL
jgi:hypothetical protein